MIHTIITSLLYQATILINQPSICQLMPHNLWIHFVLRRTTSFVGFIPNLWIGGIMLLQKEQLLLVRLVSLAMLWCHLPVINILIITSYILDGVPNKVHNKCIIEFMILDPWEILLNIHHQPLLNLPREICLDLC